MKKTILMGLAISLISIACNKQNQEVKENVMGVGQDSVITNADTLSSQEDSTAIVRQEEQIIEPQIELGKISDVEPYNLILESCGCGYSTSKKKADSQSFSYMETDPLQPNGTVYVSINGRIEQFSKTQSSKVLNNGNYEITINSKSKNYSNDGYLKMNISITKLGETSSKTFELFGGCGCDH